MASDLNVVMITGRLTAEPELRFTSRGTAAASLRLASSRYWKAPDSGDGEFRKQSVFITVETFGKTAERVAASRHKGDAVLVRGRLVYEEWADAQGEKKRAIKLFSDDVSFVPANRAGTESASADAGDDSEDSPHAEDAALDTAPDGIVADAAGKNKLDRESRRVRH